MSNLFGIQAMLMDTNAEISRLERQLVEVGSAGALPSMLLTAKSLRKRQLDLEADFLAEANNIGLDVCSYRVFGVRERPTIRGITSVLGSFQTLVSIVYETLKTGSPRERGRVSPESAGETAFEWGYAFSGSFGIVLTLPNERRLFGETKLDDAFQAIFSMAKARTPADLREFAKDLGIASVRAVYNWAHNHVESGLGVDIEWRREHLILSSLQVARPELEELEQVINETSDETTENVSVEGQLVGADIERKTFHMTFQNAEDIRGTFTAAIDATHTVTLPRRYRAHLLKRSKIYYSIEREEVAYSLLGLEELR